MGTTLESVLSDLNDLKQHITYYLQCVNKKEQPELEKTLEDLEQKLKQIEESR